MAKYLLESLESGSHGIIPDEGLNYFVGQKRITVYKDGKKVLDKEIDIDSDGNISKYNIVCDGGDEIELEPVKDVEEYNVANMLPQVFPDGAVLRKESEEDITFDFMDDLNTVLETCDNILNKIEAYSVTSESTNEETDEVITESSVVTEENIMYGEEAGEPIDPITAGKVVDDKEVAKSEFDKIKRLAEDKVNFLIGLKEEMKAKNDAKVRDIKKQLIKNQQKFRETISKFSSDTKKAMTKTYGTINKSNAEQVNIDNFMEQMRRDTETAIRNSQQAINDANQAVQTHMMINSMM